MLNLHRVYISLLLSMESELQYLTDDLAILTRLNNILKQVKDKIGSDDAGLLKDLVISEEFLDTYRFETLNEAQIKRCISCYLHSILNERALTPPALYSDVVYDKSHYRFILLYKLTDALRIYHYWTGLEQDFNDTKLIMMVAYIIGIVLSACCTVYMFNRYFRQQKERQAEYEKVVKAKAD